MSMIQHLISLGQIWQGCFIATIARRGKFNIDATLGKENTTLATPFLLLPCSTNQIPYAASSPSLSRALFLLHTRYLLYQGTCKTPKSLEISPWNHQEWGVLMSLRNSRYIWTSAHLCRWNNAAWDCRGQWAPCHRKAGQFWRGNETRSTVRPSSAQELLKWPSATKPCHANFTEAALWLCFIRKGLVSNHCFVVKNKCKPHIFQHGLITFQAAQLGRWKGRRQASSLSHPPHCLSLYLIRWQTLN